MRETNLLIPGPTPLPPEVLHGTGGLEASVVNFLSPGDRASLGDLGHPVATDAGLRAARQTLEIAVRGS